MKVLLLSAVIFGLVFANTDKTVIRGYQQQITADTLSSRLHFFASDFFDGRETGTRGQKRAAHHLVSEYRKLGLSPYFQSFTVYRRTPKRTHLEVTIDGKKTTSSLRPRGRFRLQSTRRVSGLRDGFGAEVQPQRGTKC